MSKIETETPQTVSPPPAGTSRLPQAVALFAALLAFWQLNSGHTDGLMLALGLASCAVVVWLARHVDILDAEGVPLHLLPRAVTYFPWLAVEIVKANLDVARCILGGRAAIDPCVFRTRASQANDLGRVVYANSITLTPGTVTMDVAPDGMLTVHALTRAGREGVESGDMDRRVSRFMGEA